MQVIGTLVDFIGEIEFMNNTLREEGCLHLLSFGQIRISKGTHFIFDGNLGR